MQSPLSDIHEKNIQIQIQRLWALAQDSEPVLNNPTDIRRDLVAAYLLFSCRRIYSCKCVLSSALRSKEYKTYFAIYVIVAVNRFCVVIVIK